MKVKFTVYLEGSGPTVAKAYQDMRRKLLPIRGWYDSDEAVEVDAVGAHFYLTEGEVQDARRAFRLSKDGRRRCNGGTACLHDVVVYGIPACMMTAAEVKKMVKRGHRLIQGQDKSS